VRASVAKQAVRKLARRRQPESGRLQSLGQDFDRGHRNYVRELPDWQQVWLRTKPYSAPPSRELAECLRTFSHVVEHLGLGLRAQVLDVGCGPGWMSELLARCGYWVTGIDISEDMVEIARERIDRIPRPIGEGIEPVGEFHAMPVKELPWSNRFDAAVLYDTMHHFDDELETLRAIQRSLVPGGLIYIREGSRPQPGSEAEENLIEEMRVHETLESPFSPKYLLEVVRRAGFEDVRSLLEVDELIDLSDKSQPLRALKRFLRYRSGKGEMNTVLARKPLEVGVPSDAENFSARLEHLGPWESAPGSEQSFVWVEASNVGRAFWPSSTGFPYPTGVVTVAPYALDASGGRVELGRAMLPHGVSPGGSARVPVGVPRDAAAREVRIDLVREGLAWFADLGSEPLVVRPES
jgi:SAM-dependent methyltransferase